MSRPGVGFEVEDLGNGLFDVRKDGRAVAYDQEVEEALRLVRRGGGRSYTLIEADGYRTVQRV